ncbi:MAG: CatA-like O-acetyltransferase, partial [Eubacteriales bacterium]
DVTELREACHISGQSFYLNFLYVVSYIVNARDEFRMTLVRSRGEYHPALWNTIHPVHNIFREDTETYVSVFSLWERDRERFCRNCSDDMERAKTLSVRSVPAPPNCFEASCIPWRHFTSVGISHTIPDGASLAPIIVWGRFCKTGERTYLPLSITIHHAAADGFHLARFLNEAEKLSAVVAEKIVQQTG